MMSFSVRVVDMEWGFEVAVVDCVMCKTLIRST